MAEELRPIPFDALVDMMKEMFLSSGDVTRPPDANDLLEGSVLLAIFEGVAHPLEFLMYQIAVVLPQRFFLNEATGDALDRLVENFTFGQVVRVPASTGAGTIVIEGEDGVTLPANSDLDAPNGVVVRNIVAGTINVGEEDVEVGAVSQTTGAISNLVMGTELTMRNPVPGITRIYVPETWSGGADEQSDESLRAAVIEFIDSLAKAVRAAIAFGFRQAGYDRVVIVEKGAGRLICYLDNGAAVNLGNIATARNDVHLNWKAAGIRLTALPYVEKVVNITAKAFSDGTVPLATLQANIATKWAQVFSAKRMGEGLDLLDDLRGPASVVAGYNGLNLDAPTADITVREASNAYWTEYGAGGMYPYERLKLGTVTWV